MIRTTYISYNKRYVVYDMLYAVFAMILTRRSNCVRLKTVLAALFNFLQFTKRSHSTTN